MFRSGRPPRSAATESLDVEADVGALADPDGGGVVKAAQSANGGGVASLSAFVPEGESEPQADVTATSNRTSGDNSHQSRRVTAHPVW